MKSNGKNIKQGISLFLGFCGKDDNNKYVQLEIGHVAVQCKEVYSSEK